MSARNKTAAAASNQSKSASIRHMITSNPELGNRAIAQLLADSGTKVSAQEVAQQRSRLKKQSSHSPAALTVDDIKTIKKIINEHGGFKKISALLAETDRLSEAAGGADKLRRGLSELEALAAIPTKP